MDEVALTAALETNPHVRWAVLFGSQARGRARAASDVDVAISFSRELSPQELGLLAADLEAAAGRPVDVVLADEAPPALAFRIFREGRVLVCRDREAFVDRKARAILEWIDFRPVAEACTAGVLRRARGG